MAPNQVTGPMLLRKTRKYGRHDYERFDHLASTSACVGYGSIEKVKVNCRFRFAQSQWGVLGEAKNPAGIIYLDLDFDQPSNCRLASAVVLVTLEEVPAGDAGGTGELGLDSPLCPVKFTEHYGPKCISGEQREMHVKDTRHLNPHAEAFGFGGGLFKLEKEKTKLVAGRWMFSGQLIPGKERQWAYETLKWELAENPLEDQACHANVIRTAFAFEHNGRQFTMTVKVKGTLTNWSDRFRKKMRFGKNENSTVTLVRFSEQYSFRRSLDELAGGLRWEMEAKNMAETPIEVSDAMPANFQQESSPPLSLSTTQSDPFLISEPLSAAQIYYSNQRAKRLQSGPIEQPVVLAPPDQECSLSDIARAVGLPPPQLTEEEPPNDSSTHPSTSVGSLTTLIDTELEADADQNTNRQGVDNANMDMLMWLSKIRIVMALVQLIYSILGYQSKQRAGKEKTTPPLEKADKCIPLGQQGEDIHLQRPALTINRPVSPINMLPSYRPSPPRRSAPI